MAEKFEYNMYELMVARLVREFMLNRDLDTLDEIIAENVVSNPGLPIEQRGSHRMLLTFQQIWHAFPDLAIKTLSIGSSYAHKESGFVDVFAHFKVTGTFKNELFGIQPNGNLISWDEMARFQFSTHDPKVRMHDPKVHTHWALIDSLTLMELLRAPHGS